MKTVWVLTQEINDYNQCGEYFVKVFAKKPSLGTLATCLVLPTDMGKAIKLTEHVLNGGGRVDDEDSWYFLREISLEEF